MKTKHLCIHKDDEHMPLVTVVSVPVEATEEDIKSKVACWAEHLGIVGLDDGGLDAIKWFEVYKSLGKTKLNKRFDTDGESDDEREFYNQAAFAHCKEFAIHGAVSRMHKDKDFIYKCPECGSTNILVMSIGTIASTYKDGKRIERVADDIIEDIEIECGACGHNENRADQGGDHLDDETFHCYENKK